MDDLDCVFMLFFNNARDITVYIFGNGNSNKLVHCALNPFLAKGLLPIFLNIAQYKFFSIAHRQRNNKPRLDNTNNDDSSSLSFGNDKELLILAQLNFFPKVIHK